MKNAIAALLSGFFGSLGLGGGGILLIYLIFFLKEEQITAQGINLLFFIPCAAVSTLIYSIKKMIDYKNVFIAFLGGIPGILIGNYILSLISPALLGKAFGLFLLFSGIKALFRKETS